MSFWDGMKLWEKMLFVLGVGMGLTLFYAITKLIISKRRIRKYTKLNEARRSHLESVRASRNIIQLRGEEVPFGIKALEAGIEVEGVVVSRSVTPASSRQTLVGSDNDSLASRANGHNNGAGTQMQHSGKPMVYQPSPYVAVPPAVYHTQSAHSSLRSSATSLASNSGPSTLDGYGGSHGRRSYSDPNFHQDSSRNVSGSGVPQSVSSPDAITLARLEGRLPPLPRRSGPPRTRSPPIQGYVTYNALHSPTVTPPSRSPPNRSPGSSRTPSPPEDARNSSGLPSVHEDESEDSSRHSDSSLEGMSSSRPRLMTAFSTPVISIAPGTITPGTIAPGTYSNEGDLSLLHTHRLSHAAEVGQLTPRPRVPRVSSLPQTSSASFVSAPPDQAYELDIEALQQAIPQVEGAADLDPHNYSPPLAERRRANSDPNREQQGGDSVQETLDQTVGTGGVDALTSSAAEIQTAFEQAANKISVSKPKKLQKKNRASRAASKDDIDLEAQ